MSALDPNTRSLIELARSAEDPSFADRARVRGKLGIALGAAVGGAAAGVSAGRGLDSGTHFANPASLPAAAKTATWLGLFKGGVSQTSLWLVVGSVVGGAALLFAAKSMIAPTTATEPTSDALAQPSMVVEPPSPVTPAPHQASHVVAPGSQTTNQPADTAITPQANAPIAPEDLPVLEAPRAVLRDATSRRAAGEGRKPRRPSLVPQPVLPHGRLSLAEEARELSAVHAALREGEASAALARLDSMDRRPGGALREERVAARVLALCGLGRVHEAENAARRFRALAPESPLLPRLGGSCAHEALSPNTGR